MWFDQFEQTFHICKELLRFSIQNFENKIEIKPRMDFNQSNFHLTFLLSWANQFFLRSSRTHPSLTYTYSFIYNVLGAHCINKQSFTYKCCMDKMLYAIDIFIKKGMQKLLLYFQGCIALIVDSKY